MDLSAATFDTSCTQDTDCIEVTLGIICTGGCLCGGASINQTDEPKYDQIISSIQPGACDCPLLGAPHCVANQCVSCGGATPNTPGCPDAGQ